MFPVYAKKSCLGEKPITWVTREEKDWMLSSGAATSFKKRGTALRLTRDKMIGDSSDLRDSSLQMGPSVIEAAADDKKWAEILMKCWFPKALERMVEAARDKRKSQRMRAACK